MKPSLQLKLSQQLTMTPQLQQAIKLLQLSSLDLQTEIQEVIDSNPMLETIDESLMNHQNENLPTINSINDTTHDTQGEKSNQEAIDEFDPYPVSHSSWEDNYIGQSGASFDNSFEGKDIDIFNMVSESLQDHLIWQLNLTPFSPQDRLIAIALIESINDDGYLTGTLEDILSIISSEEVELEDIEVVLHRIQHFDPIGVGARDLKECLSVQLLNHVQDPLFKTAKSVIENDLELLAARELNKIQKSYHINEEQLNALIKLIRSLNPKPGSVITSKVPQYIVPDLKVVKLNDRWCVELNHETLPKLRINPNYSSLIRRADNSSDNTFLKNSLQEAKWFIKSLQSRNETLLKVAQKIVEYQQDFFEHGEVAMRPLVLQDIAQAIEMHESTVSRVTTQKYIHTQRGVYELKYFFSSHVNTASGGECSSTAIRALIKKLVAHENKGKPLSDNKIALLLKEQGINVARRTIAKYREAMAIPPSNERKCL